ncbi:hypothetical protein Pst134EB_010853 [Puccinia striiformis f. sp. tritici]|nr:hypothetical protein Pst134EB_010853 [Puccinia striiformis f. sp. tritici]
MSNMSLFQRGYIAVALFALIITLHEAQVSAGTVDCTSHFWANPKAPRASCISEADPKKDHSCALDSCSSTIPVIGEPGKFKTTSWFEFTFRNCHHGKTPANIVNVKQYFRHKGLLPRTALGSGGTAITRTTKVTMITSLVATAPKHAMLSLPRLKEIEKRELLQHLPPPLPSFFHRLKLYRTYLSASSWGI